MLHTFQFNYYVRDCLSRSCYCERETIHFNACNNNNNVGQQTVVQIYLNRDIIAQMTIVQFTGPKRTLSSFIDLLPEK